MKHRFFLFTITISALFTVFSCKENNTGRKTIAVSIPPQAALLEEIAGDSVNIVTLMQSEANPEAFEVSVSNMRAVNDAALYMKMGNLAFEETLTDRIRQSNTGMHIADVSEGIELIYGTHSHGNHTHDVADPHTWTSLHNLKTIASNMLAALTETDPANKDFYNANYNRLIARLDSTDAAIAARLADARSKSFLIWHPSLSYFARDYGLRQIAVGQDNKEMTPGQLRDVHTAAAADSAAVMFMQQNFDTRQAESLAGELGVEVVTVNPLDADYIKQFNIITDALSRH